MTGGAILMATGLFMMWAGSRIDRAIAAYDRRTDILRRLPAAPDRGGV